MQKIDSAKINARLKPNKLEIYGVSGLIKLGINILRTKFIHKNIRLIRFPIQIRGYKHIDFGVGATFGVGCRIEAYPYLHKGNIIEFGNGIEMNDYVHITGINSVIIGNNVLIASKIYISDSNHGSYKGDKEDSDPRTIVGKRNVQASQVIIGDNVWLGESVSVLAGSNIGKCSIIGANSVVNGIIPEYTIAAGTPAVPIKKYNFETNRWEKIQ